VGQFSIKIFSEMIGLISHQLKQPLNVLSLYCEDLKLSYDFDELNTAYMQEFYKTNKQQITYMNETINGFLNFFNPNKIKAEFFINNPIKQAINILSGKIEKLNLSFNLDIDEELKTFGVEVELTQVLINIINNSLDAFIQRKIIKPEIFIKLFKKDHKNIIIIEDNAGGIENNQIDKLMDPYFTTKENGTGIGLYMVKMIIKNSFDGEIKVSNTQNGLSFIIFLKDY
jgi:signal transduction histidine kinase